MARLIRHRLRNFSLIGLFLFGLVNLAQNVYSQVETVLTTEERAEYDEAFFRDLAHCEPPTREELARPVAEVQEEFIEEQKCVLETAVKTAVETNAEMEEELRESVQKEKEPEEVPESSACSVTQKKALAENSRQGGTIPGYLEGKDGAQTNANRPGSTGEYVLLDNDRNNCHLMTLQRMTSDTAVRDYWCNENPDECTQTTSAWYNPFQIVHAALDMRELSTLKAERRAEVEATIAETQAFQRQAQQEMASFQNNMFLDTAFTAEADKTQEVRAKTAVLTSGTRGETPELGLVRKLDQGGPAHTGG